MEVDINISSCSYDAACATKILLVRKIVICGLGPLGHQNKKHAASFTSGVMWKYINKVLTNNIFLLQLQRARFCEK